MSGQNKPKWLSRRISAPGPYLTLCLSQREFDDTLKHCKLPLGRPWLLTPQAHASAHVFQSPTGMTAVICVSDFEGRDPVEIAGLLVHEAVHVWQEWCDYYGEHTPGREQEAYAIQGISQELMAEFARRMGMRQT